MKWQSALAIYVLFWSLCVFFVLPFGVKTSQEAGVEMVPGQADSAPASFSLAKVAIRTTIVSTILFAIFLLNYIFGWVTTEMLDWAH
ncbi:DUF1467 family protein [Sphingomonas sp. AOB5]|uniref:DUF1467 family protein n=1 Tax=Sphingomonas sp. AOB5 TaxID=3034017 RepID=UPI0023F77F53|nr:DUF1467 family protein [Sphingomonas sp. AOB5]MDF7773900.1 DUF1467 family protein [Sphingomonas sp. AOB5]